MINHIICTNDICSLMLIDDNCPLAKNEIFTEDDFLKKIPLENQNSFFTGY